MARALHERGLQFPLGGEFAETPQIDDFCLKALGRLGEIDRFQPLVMLQFPGNGAGISTLRFNTNGKERQIFVAPDLEGLGEFCLAEKVKGVILFVPSLDPNKLLYPEIEAIRNVFVGFGKVKSQDSFKVWLVDRDAGDLPVNPHNAKDKERLDQKRKMIGEMGLCRPQYFHSSGERIGWFEAGLPKKAQIKERDYSDDERIKFLRDWLSLVIQYRGGRIVNVSDLNERLGHSKSLFLAMQKIQDARGVVSQESCGCLVHTLLNGDTEELLRCEGDSCFRDKKPKDTKPPFSLGRDYSVAVCMDCGSPRVARAYWADVDRFHSNLGIPVSYKISCQRDDSHSMRDIVFVDPARILNPMYVFNCLHPKEGKDKKAA